MPIHQFNWKTDICFNCGVDRIALTEDPSIPCRRPSKARKTHTYRFAKRNRARSEHLIWRRLPRVWTRNGQVIVDI
jgi:hypothetical protein